MDIIKLMERSMSMSEEVWERHANPWSVYSRFAALPLVSLAFWSREWIGIFAIVPIAFSFLFVWINPRLFRPPQSTNNWASMVTFGERIYLQRSTVEIPLHHQKACLVLQGISAIGLPLFIYGLYSLNLDLLIVGNLWLIIFKTWFCDRMVWLYLDMKSNTSEYQSWLKP